MTTKILTILFLTGATLAAQAPGATGRTARKTSAKSTAPKALTIPADAKLTPDGTYAWTDKQGKKWIYSKTPFGVMRSAAQDGADAASDLAGVKAVEAGDTVRFTKPSPFGPIQWEKKKTDLTDEERAVLKRQSATQDGKQD